MDSMYEYELTARLSEVCHTAFRSGRFEVPADARASLMVLSDALQERGDLRGELIALDLSVEPASVRERCKRDLHARWLGDDLPGVRSYLGMLEVEVEGASAPLDRILSCGARQQLVRVGIQGTGHSIRSCLRSLVSEPCESLRDLGVFLLRPPAQRPVIDEELATTLVHSTPRLHTLELSGLALVANVSHPSIRRLIVSGNALDSLIGDGAPWPSVASIDLAFYANHELAAEVADVARLLPATHFSGLTALDLSRNEPGYDPTRYLGGDINTYRVLPTLGVLAQLEHLRLDSLRTAHDAEQLQAALNMMPRLQSLQITERYIDAPIIHDTARLLLPPVWPWPPRDNMVRAQSSLELPSGHTYVLLLREIISVLERTYAQLPTSTQVAWRAFWRTVDDSDETQGLPLPIAALAEAIRAVEPSLLDETWKSLARDLRTPMPGDMAILRFVS